MILICVISFINDQFYFGCCPLCWKRSTTRNRFQHLIENCNLSKSYLLCIAYCIRKNAICVLGQTNTFTNRNQSKRHHTNINVSMLPLSFAIFFAPHKKNEWKVIRTNLFTTRIEFPFQFFLHRKRVNILLYHFLFLPLMDQIKLKLILWLRIVFMYGCVCVCVFNWITFELKMTIQTICQHQRVFSIYIQFDIKMSVFCFARKIQFVQSYIKLTKQEKKEWMKREATSNWTIFTCLISKNPFFMIV